MSRKNKVALAILLAGLTVAATYDPVIGALICIIAGMYAE